MVLYVCVCAASATTVFYVDNQIVFSGQCVTVLSQKNVHNEREIPGLDPEDCSELSLPFPFYLCRRSGCFKCGRGAIPLTIWFADPDTGASFLNFP